MTRQVDQRVNGSMTSVRHPLFSRLYSRFAVPAMARAGGEDLRRRALVGLVGTVVEVGAGDGANLRHYPDSVDRIVAVEPEPYLRERASAHAEERVQLRDAEATALPLADGEADAVVFSLVLCSVDQTRALAEARRVLAPGGELRFLEHVRSPQPGVLRRLQQGLDASVWPLLFGGCHCARDTETAIAEAGFRILEIERFSFPPGSRGVESSLILGRALVA